MPSAACRILLEVMDVRVDKLQDISYEDAISEGCEFGDVISPVHRFVEVWDGIHQGQFTWNENPLVFVVCFKLAGLDSSSDFVDRYAITVDSYCKDTAGRKSGWRKLLEADR
jgi:hypothetical protein